jgi:6-pyruvoyl-tetrahydropterin synthase
MQDCHTGRYQRPLYNPLVDGDIVSWNSNEYHPFDNYGYPLALDTHVFQAAKMQELISCFDFKNTNQLESNMQQYTVTINRMYSFTHSVAVNIPMNNMSTITRAGEKYSYSLEELNNAFLEGRIIDLGHLAQETFIGCHQEAELRLI